VLPFSETEMLLVASAAIGPTLKFQVTDLTPAGTATDGGTESTGPLDDTARVFPAAHAGLDRLTVQLPFVFGPTEEGVH